ncbi:hypothetical protein GCM10010315_40300 [Streptomyces luteosporeus]|uniref:Uncharacterized protein n=1 Tax=Streptomyces luteosporeus TaxID=173856 RepID=A0ABN3TX72_9ACTN
MNRGLLIILRRPSQPSPKKLSRGRVHCSATHLLLVTPWQCWHVAQGHAAGRRGAPRPHLTELGLLNGDWW